MKKCNKGETLYPDSDNSFNLFYAINALIIIFGILAIERIELIN